MVNPIDIDDDDNKPIEEQQVKYQIVKQTNNYDKWFIAALFTLAGVTYANVTSSISQLNVDYRSLLVRVEALELNIEKLDGRIDSLRDNINEQRKLNYEQQQNDGNNRNKK